MGLSQKPPWTKERITAEVIALRDQVFGRTFFGGGKGQSRGGQFAEGGPVVGPGTGTSDDVPAFMPETGTRYRLSNDEHILTAAEVKAAGGHGNIYALRKTIRS